MKNSKKKHTDNAECNRRSTGHSNGGHRPKCNEIWLCYLEEGNGSVQGGYRPVLVASNDVNNKHSRTVNVIPFTRKDNKDKADLPVHVKIRDYERFGLRKPSIALIEQLTTVNKDNLKKRLGYIGDAFLLGKIRDAMKVQFPFLS